MASCQLNEHKAEICSGHSTDTITQTIHRYRISENVTIDSKIAIPHFDIDSIDTYSYYGAGGKYTYIKDKDGRLFFCTMIAEQRPAILKEEIYLDYDSAKYRYFVFDDTGISNENRNRVFIGTVLTSTEQVKVQEYLNTFKGEIPPPLIRTPNYISSDIFRPIKREYNDKNGNHKVVVEDRLGNDSIITLEPEPDISRFKNRFRDY